MSKVIAKVNDEEIKQEELDRLINAYKQQTGKKEISEKEEKNLLERLVQSWLLIEEAKKRNLEVSDQMLQQQLNQFYQQYQGEDNFKKILKQQGIDLENFKEKIKVDLKGQLTVNDEVKKKMDIKEDELKEYYENNKKEMKSKESFKASHILFSAKEDEEKAEKDAKDVRQKIKDGEDFSNMAKKHSDCPSKQNGGDLGFFSKGKMVPKFEKAVADMDEGEISDPVKTQFGYHLIKKTGYKPEKQLNYEESKQNIKKTISEQKSQVIVQNLIEELKENFDIEYM